MTVAVYPSHRKSQQGDYLSKGSLFFDFFEKGVVVSGTRSKASFVKASYRTGI